jgi:hypothetical protein
MIKRHSHGESRPRKLTAIGARAGVVKGLLITEHFTQEVRWFNNFPGRMLRRHFVIWANCLSEPEK